MPRSRRTARFLVLAATLSGLAVTTASPAVAATHSTKLSFSYSAWKLSGKPAAGAPLKVTGSASGPVGRTVELQRYTSGAWHNLATTHTGKSGKFALAPRIGSTGTYTLRVEVPARTGWASHASSTWKVAYSATPTPLTLSASSLLGGTYTVEWNDRIDFQARGQSWTTSRTVDLQQYSAGAWHTIASRNLASRPGTCLKGTPSPYSVDLCGDFLRTASTPGKFTYRLYAPATATAVAGRSSSWIITVVPSRPVVNDVEIECTGNTDGTATVALLLDYTAFNSKNGATTPNAPAPWQPNGGFLGYITKTATEYYVRYRGTVAPGATLPPVTLTWHNPQSGVTEAVPIGISDPC